MQSVVAALGTHVDDVVKCRTMATEGFLFDERKDPGSSMLKLTLLVRNGSPPQLYLPGISNKAPMNDQSVRSDALAL